MTNALVSHEETFGPAMRALRETQRAFVLAILDSGSGDASAAYRVVHPDVAITTARVNGSRLIHDPRILAAMHEEGVKRMHSGVILSINTVLEIAAGSHGAKAAERLKAAAMILNRVGMHEHTEHRVVIERGDDRGTIDKIKALAEKLGVDPKKLLGEKVVDAEFTDVTPSTEGIEDIL